MKRTDDYIEGRCRIRLLDFCHRDRKRETGRWGKCSVIDRTEGVMGVESNVSGIQEGSAKLDRNE